MRATLRKQKRLRGIAFKLAKQINISDADFRFWKRNPRTNAG